MRFWISGITAGFHHSSVGKESSCNARNPRSIPVLGRSTGEGIGYPLQYSWASRVLQLVKKICLQWRRPVFDPWVGRSPGEGKSYSLQFSGLENSMDCLVHGVAKSWIGLSIFVSFTIHIVHAKHVWYGQGSMIGLRREEARVKFRDWEGRKNLQWYVFCQWNWHKIVREGRIIQITVTHITNAE